MLRRNLEPLAPEPGDHLLRNPRVLVDRSDIDDPDLIFKREGGGFTRPDKVFNGQLQPVLESFNDALWTLPAAG